MGHKTSNSAKQTEQFKRGGCLSRILKLLGVFVGIFIVICILLFIFVPDTPTGTPVQKDKTNNPEITQPTANVPADKEKDYPQEPEHKEPEQEPIAAMVSVTPLNNGDEKIDILGNYSFEHGYNIEISKASDENVYSFVITFSLAGKNWVVGTMTLGEEYSFALNGFDSYDEGTLSFYLKDNSLCLKYSGSVNGSFDDVLVKTSGKDYSGYNFEDYGGEYYSPTGGYEIEMIATPTQAFFVTINYASGLSDSGTVIPGVETNLDKGTILALDLNDDKTIHVVLRSPANSDGIFNEDVSPGHATEIANARSLNNLSVAELIPALCAIEERCVDMTVSGITGNPMRYCDGAIYRFAGEVVTTFEGGFLLKLSSAVENNLIVCRYDFSVSVGDKICVYGRGSGTGAYCRTYENGIVKEFDTLLVDVGYVLREDVLLGSAFPDYLENIVIGNYSLSKGASSYLLEDDLAIEKDSINGRELRIKDVALTYAASNITDIIGRPVKIRASTETTSTKGYDCSIVFFFALDGSGFTYSGHQASATSAAEVEYATYDKMG